MNCKYKTRPLLNPWVLPIDPSSSIHSVDVCAAKRPTTSLDMPLQVVEAREADAPRIVELQQLAYRVERLRAVAKLDQQCRHAPSAKAATSVRASNSGDLWMKSASIIWGKFLMSVRSLLLILTLTEPTGQGLTCYKPIRNTKDEEREAC